MAEQGCGAGSLAGKIAVATILSVTTIWSGRAVMGQAGTAIALRELSVPVQRRGSRLSSRRRDCTGRDCRREARQARHGCLNR
jgi:hypothetical protein